MSRIAWPTGVRGCRERARASLADRAQTEALQAARAVSRAIWHHPAMHHEGRLDADSKRNLDDPTRRASSTCSVRRVAAHERARFQGMVFEYWDELMPKADAISTPEKRIALFEARFANKNPDQSLCWILIGDQQVGFICYRFLSERRSATIEDLYVAPHARRRRTAATAVRRVLADLDRLGVEQIDLNVRRDNPVALRFWESIGFSIALYRLRAYRDPERGEMLRGALSSDQSK